MLAGVRIEEHEIALIIVALVKIEHLRERVCESIKRPLADPFTVEPVVLNEPKDGALVRY